MIDKAYQKKGYARSALRLAFSKLKAQGFCTLLAGVVRGEHSPLGFYLLEGFIDTKETNSAGELILRREL